MQSNKFEKQIKNRNYKTFRVCEAFLATLDALGLSSWNKPNHKKVARWWIVNGTD